MSTNPLLAAFNAAVGFFNAQDWAHLHPLLDDFVTMTRIDDPLSFHKGKSKILFYCYTHGTTDRAVFTPDTATQQTKTFGTIGLVIGSADWQNTSTASKRKVAYAFSFINKNGNWLALNLWGAYQ